MAKFTQKACKGLGDQDTQGFSVPDLRNTSPHPSRKRKEAEKDKTKVGKGRRGCTSVALSFINVEFIANICNLGCCI